MLELIYISIFGTLIAIILVAALRPLAIHLKLVDRPGDRKVHKGDIPLVGGPVIWVVVLFGVLIFIKNPPWSALFAATMLVVLGVIDDRQPVPATIKLVFHIAAATIVVMGENLAISNIGVLAQTYPLPTFSAIHTILAVVAITVSINAFNMIDGIDGLAASLALLALTHAVIAFDLIIGGAPADYATFAFLVSGALAGFLMFNLEIFNSRKVFLGDSGSMLIGLIVAIALIGASQETNRLAGSPNIPPTLCLWILAIPITDITCIVIRRLANGRSPLAPDRTHLHHKIMEYGFSARRTLLILILSAVGAFWIGLVLTLMFGEIASFAGYLAFIPVYYFSILRVCKFCSRTNMIKS